MSVEHVVFQNSGSMLLPANPMLLPGQFLMSENGRYYLRLKPEGDLVIEQDGAQEEDAPVVKFCGE